MEGEVFVRLLIPFLLLALGWGVGRAVEAAHFRALRLREIRWRAIEAMTLEKPPETWRVEQAGLVAGSVVISIDHWKRFIAALRGIFGGRIPGFESLLERARREAVIRMKQSAAESGFNAIVGIRLETARLASARSDGKGTAGVEILAFGTGIRRDR